MDAHLFRKFAEVFERQASGARIEKIQEIAPGHTQIAFFGNSRKLYLRLRFGRKDPFCYTSSVRVEGLARPSAPIMRLRKYCEGRSIAAIVSQIWSRKLWLMAGGLDGGRTVWLCFDLAKGASLHFLDQDDLPQPEECAWPQAANLAACLENWRDWPVLTPALRKSMSFLPSGEQAALMADLADGGGDIFLYKNQNGAIARVSAWPLPAAQKGDLTEIASEDAALALEKAGQELVLGALAGQKLKERAAPGQKRINQIRKLLEKLDSDEARLSRMAALEKPATALAANLWRFDKDMKAERLDLEADGEKIAIPLQARFTLQANMERMFHEMRRGKRGLAMLAGRRRELAEELAALEGGAPVAEPAQKRAERHAASGGRLPKHVQAFTSSDGYQILRGKDAKGNLAVLRMASGHDLWAHVERGAGAHVILRLPHAGYEPPERALLEAGGLALNKSWLAGAASGSVMYAEARHVKPSKRGPAGQVFIDRIKETREVPVDASLEEKLASRSFFEKDKEKAGENQAES